MNLKQTGWMVLTIFLAHAAFAAPVLTILSTKGAPGTTVQIPVAFLTDTNVLSVQFDLRYNPEFLTASDPAAGDALSDHVVASSPVSTGTMRVALNSFSNAQLKNGVLVFIPLTISTNELPGIENLTLTNVVVLDANTNRIRDLTVANGAITVGKVTLSAKAW